jgi:hypothetical protein
MDSDLVISYKDKETHVFPKDGRDDYLTLMKKIGYVELPDFENANTNLGYFCGSCIYRVDWPESPTGSWCVEYDFPDRPYGCCDHWVYREADPALIKESIEEVVEFLAENPEAQFPGDEVLLED